MSPHLVCPHFTVTHRITLKITCGLLLLYAAAPPLFLVEDDEGAASQPALIILKLEIIRILQAEGEGDGRKSRFLRGLEAQRKSGDVWFSSAEFM